MKQMQNIKVSGQGYSLKAIEKMYGLTYSRVSSAADRNDDSDYIVTVNERGVATTVRVCNNIIALLQSISSDIEIDTANHDQLVVKGFKLSEIEKAERGLTECFDRTAVLTANLERQKAQYEDCVSAQKERIQRLETANQSLAKDHEIERDRANDLLLDRDAAIEKWEKEFERAKELDAALESSQSDNLRLLAKAETRYNRYQRRVRKLIAATHSRYQHKIQEQQERERKATAVRNSIDNRKKNGFLNGLLTATIIATIVSSFMVFGINSLESIKVNPYNFILAIIFSAIFAVMATINAHVQRVGTSKQKKVSWVAVFIFGAVEFFLHFLSFNKGLNLDATIFTQAWMQIGMSLGLAGIIAGANVLSQWLRRTE
jgi:DNA polymerase III alpha subunit (gram-positive type)